MLIAIAFFVGMFAYALFIADWEKELDGRVEHRFGHK